MKTTFHILHSLFLLAMLTITAEAVSSRDGLIKAALERTENNIVYDGSYHVIAYPGGDVPENIGVCTDVVIRSYRKIGYDLQKLVHEDIRTNFNKYPSKKIWGLDSPDRNIDHRRVLNLQVFFSRFGKTLKVTSNAADYNPGDLVTWNVAGNLPHIGIVTDMFADETGNPMIVHNIGAGPKLEDMLFSFPITGHYSYLP